PRVNPHPEQKTEEAQRELAEARLDKNQQVKPSKTRTGKPRDLQTVLDELFPDKNIKTYPLIGSVVLIGTADPRTVERVIRVAEVFYPSVISHLNEAVTLPQTSRNGPSETTDEVTRHTLPNQLRELRQDVKVLRGSVSQLIDLLQEQVDKTQPQEPPSIDSESSNTPATEPVAVIWETIGIRAEPTDFDAGSRYRGGLKILEVRPESPAAKEGMRLGDVLVGLDKWETLESKNLVFALDQLKENHSDQLKFYLLRGNETLFGHLKLAPHPNLKSNSAEDNALTSPVGEPTSFWRLSLDAVIDIALQNSKVTRNLIGVTLDNDSNVILLESNADLDINQFEVAAKKLVGDVEEAYWELWLADRELETARAARDSAKKLWSDIKERQLNGDESKSEVQLRQEYFACRAQTDASLKKLHGSERALRFLIGLASSDGRLIQATDKPATSPLKVVRKEALANTLAKAPELRQQRSTIRSIELQLKAAKDILLPTITTDPELVTGEALPDAELSIGTRKRLAQVRNLELRLAHEKARLEEAMSAHIPDPTIDLKPNDRLTIESLADKNLNRDVTILADGTITLPLLGQVVAAGRTLEKQREELESLYKKYYRKPELTLSFYGTSTPVHGIPVKEDGADGSVLGRSESAPNPTADLQPGDRLLLESLAEERLTRKITILRDGTVTLPLLGQVPAAGRTLATLNKQLTEHYKKYFTQPEVTVSFLGTSFPSQ
ncbi:MAG: polysaccharide biosynthesis/export family protein, partial [Pirellulaceae bacterium]|nr:polysaccharide biosynthesis/export family protein [Pirellulaceae bacterium]